MKIIWEVLHLQKTAIEGYLSSWDPVVIRVLEVAPTRRIQRPLNQECSFLIVSPKDQVTRKQTGLCVPVMFSKMALSRTIIFALLSMQFHFVFTDGHEKPMERNRLKVNLCTQITFYWCDIHVRNWQFVLRFKAQSYWFKIPRNGCVIHEISTFVLETKSRWKVPREIRERMLSL